MKKLTNICIIVLVLMLTTAINLNLANAGGNTMNTAVMGEGIVTGVSQNSNNHEVYFKDRHTNENLIYHDQSNNGAIVKHLGFNGLPDDIIYIIYHYVKTKTGKEIISIHQVR